MDQHAKNIAVGITVIIALALLGGMILLFTGLPGFLAGGYRLRMDIPTTGGASTGDYVNLAGMRVGKITDISFTDGDPTKGITLTARIDKGINIPVGTVAVVTQQLLGGSYIELAPPSKPRIDPQTGQPYYVPKDDSAVIAGGVRTADVAAQFRPVIDSLTRLSDAVLSLIGEEPEAPEVEEPTTQELPPADAQSAPAPPRPPRAGLRSAIANLDLALQDVRQTLGAENQQNIKESLANFAKATVAATEAMDALKKFAAAAEKTAGSADELIANSNQQIEKLTSKLTEAAEGISRVVMALNQVTTSLQDGDGTAARLINDPQLYNSLVGASQQLEAMMKEFRQLVDQWKDTGVKIQLK